ncbi:MAG: N-acetylmuramoyl-L-alanine amidase [Alphaproteobacteria bacterium]|nr:N-acetylmuramoyl-L-alanine amidase [Alphaproteobacteria bacterium]MBV9905281.1 N-acetylmuramoyl-L-alanine amidase [Alphaproteobacteria bacterium]
MNRRLASILGLVAAGLVAAVAALADPADDLITKLLQNGQPPAATPPKPVPPPAGHRTIPANAPIVMGARIGEHDDKTRFVIEFSDPMTIRAFTLGNPNRVVIDMPAVQWHLDGAPRPSGNGAIKQYRYGQFRSGNSRFVIDLNRPMKVAAPLVIPPTGGFGYRAVIDLTPTTQEEFNRAAGWPEDLRAREVAAAILSAAPPPTAANPPTAERHVVVIDAGHGGIDGGTSGVNGLMEKDLVLDEALRVGRELAQRGYTVHLTRDTDVYIPLTERTRIARSWRADLFVSLHADSNPNPDVSGLSIYTLSERGSDREAAALARKENQSDIVAGVDLGGGNSAVAPILLSLAQRDSMNRSSRFAGGAIQQLTRVTDILPRQPIRSAAFVVLKAPDIPSVLIELGYLSNSADAQQMNGVRWRANVAGAVATAVDRYFTPPTGASNP